MAVEKQTFELPGPIGGDVPFGELHVWKWMDNERSKDPLAICCSTGTLRRYLRHVGFDKTTHVLREADTSVLRNALNHYGWLQHHAKTDSGNRAPS